MTKKHFIKLADMLRRAQPDMGICVSENALQEHATKRGMQDQWIFMRDELADFCKSQNGQFNRERWLSYIAGECGPNGGKVRG